MRRDAVTKNKKQKGGLIWFLLCLMVMYLAMVTSARSEDRALLIGVGRYAKFDEKLNGVDLDIQMMTEFAQILGFKRQAIKVLAHESASTSNVVSAVENWLIEGVGPQDRVLFYFSGHGSQVPDASKDEKDEFDEVLLLHDVALHQQGQHQTLTGVLVDDDFNAMLARMRSRNILVILDACHSGSATRSLHLTARSFSVDNAQVKYLSYSPYIEAASDRGSFDVMEPHTSQEANHHYVAITACRDDEKTVTTAQGSIFTLGLRQVVRSAAMAGANITPQELKRQTTVFIREQIQADAMAFHPQIAGNLDLQRHPLQLVPSGASPGFVRREMETLVNKSNETVWIKLNKSCFEIGDALEISLWIPEPGYLNIISINADDRATVLFPNQYHPSSRVNRGRMTIPDGHMGFELMTDGKPGANFITAILSQSPINAFENGFRTQTDVLATLSPKSTRSLVLRQNQDELAAGSITTRIRNEGHCQ